MQLTKRQPVSPLYSDPDWRFSTDALSLTLLRAQGCAESVSSRAQPKVENSCVFDHVEDIFADHDWDVMKRRELENRPSRSGGAPNFPAHC